MEEYSRNHFHVRCVTSRSRFGDIPPAFLDFCVTQDNKVFTLDASEYDSSNDGSDSELDEFY